ncbi:MAG: SufE family protein [Pirellulaceae bacterium]
MQRIAEDKFPLIASRTVSQASPVTLEEIIAEFQELGDWDAQCDYLIDLGYELPKLPAEAKTEANRVRGCQSNVWMTAHFTPGDSPVVEFIANSDAIIVNGLIAVLMAVFNRRTAREILTTDARAVFAQLGLERHLSSQRRNGLYGMVERIRQLALAAA